MEKRVLIANTPGGSENQVNRLFFDVFVVGGEGAKLRGKYKFRNAKRSIKDNFLEKGGVGFANVFGGGNNLVKNLGPLVEVG